MKGFGGRNGKGEHDIIISTIVFKNYINNNFGTYQTLLSLLGSLLPANFFFIFDIIIWINLSYKTLFLAIFFQEES